MVTKHKYKNIVWIDLESPKEEEVAPLAKEYRLSSSIIEELRRPSERAKADPHGKYIYLIFHLPKYRHKEDRETTQEIDFIIGKDFIITSHYEPIDLFLDVSKLLETKSILDKSENLDNSGLVFYYIMKSLYGSIENELDHIRRDLALAEKEIFIGNEGKMVHVLSKINKALIDFRHPLKAHHEILESLESKEEKLFGVTHDHNTELVIGEYKKVWGRVENNRDLLMDLRDTNDSLFAAKTNNIMKNLTIMSFLTFPLTLMTGIFGMNTVSAPIIGLENGFWIILGMMASTALIMISLFKFNRWI